jgi:hypothetical protein
MDDKKVFDEARSKGATVEEAWEAVSNAETAEWFKAQLGNGSKCGHCGSRMYYEDLCEHCGSVQAKREVPTTGCTCGAKHTSRPDYHLGYCEKSKLAKTAID